MYLILQFKIWKFLEHTDFDRIINKGDGHMLPKKKIKKLEFSIQLIASVSEDEMRHEIIKIRKKKKGTKRNKKRRCHLMIARQ